MAPERLTGLPGWAALPLTLLNAALLTAVLGMYWDISLHIDNGRDAGPLANPAHYLILLGLYGVLLSGVLSAALAGERPEPHRGRGRPRLVGAGRRSGDRHLRRLRALGLPARRHVAPAVRPGRDALGPDPPDADRRRLAGHARRDGAPVGGDRRARARPRARHPRPLLLLRRGLLAGSFLVALSTFQGEFDFGVPQFREVLHPVLIMLAAGIGLVTARVYLGRGGALLAVLGFVLIRGLISVMVGGVWGQTMPHFPLYIVEALLVEAAFARAGARSPVATGALAGG